MRKLELVAAIACVSVAVAASEADESRFVSVTGVGKVAAIPDTVEILGFVRGERELAGDALTEFLAATKEINEALQGLGVEGISVSATGLSVGGSQGISSASDTLRRLRGEVPDPEKIVFRENLVIRIEGVAKLEREKLLTMIAKIVDRGKEAGLQPGRPLSEMDRIRSDPPPGCLLFRLTNTGDVRQQARELAMQDARGNADRWAKLAGVTLGRVFSIEESSVPSYVASSLRSIEPDTSLTFEPVEITESVRVKFEIAGDTR